MSKINKVLKKEHGFPEEWGMHVACAYCGGDHTHFESVSQRESDSYEAWEGRGGAARIAMFCEKCPNLFYIRVGEHKGYSYIGIETSFVVAKMHDAR